MNIRNAEKLIGTVICPLCAAKEVDLKLRCDFGYDECLATVRCRHCGHEFEAEQMLESNTVLRDPIPKANSGDR